MAEFNVPPCPTHGALPKPLHTENFRGAVDAIIQIIDTVSGVGTVSYSKCAYGYDANFNGLVRALEDLNTTISGITAGGGGGADIQAGSGIYFTASGSATVINALVASASGVTYTAGSGLYLVNGSEFNVNFDTIYSKTISGHFLAAADLGVTYSGNNVIYSGSQGTGGGGGGGTSVTVGIAPVSGYTEGSLWFDTNEGRLFVYASGASVTDPAWYQTNAEAIVNKGELPPSGAGLNAPPRDGSLWFSNLLGSLFVYDATTSGWYETGPSRSVAYGEAAPAPSSPGAGWYSSTDSALKIWNGTAWVNAN